MEDKDRRAGYAEGNEEGGDDRQSDKTCTGLRPLRAVQGDRARHQPRMPAFLEPAQRIGAPGLIASLADHEIFYARLTQSFEFRPVLAGMIDTVIF